MTPATSIGELLANARRERAATVKDVELAIKIRGKHIEAMEHNDFKDIAEEAYVVGFLRTYAQWLGLDPDPIVVEYRRLLGGPGYENHSDESNRPSLWRFFRPLPVVSVVIFVGLILLAWSTISQASV